VVHRQALPSRSASIAALIVRPARDLERFHMIQIVGFVFGGQSDENHPIAIVSGRFDRPSGRRAFRFFAMKLRTPATSAQSGREPQSPGGVLTRAAIKSTHPLS